MNEITIRKLEEDIGLIKHYERSWINNWLNLGEILKRINESKSYKASYDTFEDCVERNFSFSRQYAYNFIKIFDKYGENVKRFDKIKTYGVKFLIISTYVEDSYVDLAVEKVETKQIEKKDMISEINRMKTQAGQAKPNQTPEDFQLQLVRQWNNIEEMIKQTLTNWIKGAESARTDEIDKLLTKATTLLDKLK